MKLVQNHTDCIGCGACISVCGDHWEMGEDGKAVIKGGKEVKRDGKTYWEKEITKIGCNQKAVDVCPVKIISVEE